MEALGVLGTAEGWVSTSYSGRRDFGPCKEELLNQQAERNQEGRT